MSTRFSFADHIPIILAADIDNNEVNDLYEKIANCCEYILGGRITVQYGNEIKLISNLLYHILCIITDDCTMGQSFCSLQLIQLMKAIESTHVKKSTELLHNRNSTSFSSFNNNNEEKSSEIIDWNSLLSSSALTTISTIINKGYSYISDYIISNIKDINDTRQVIINLIKNIFYSTNRIIYTSLNHQNKNNKNKLKIALILSLVPYIQSRWLIISKSIIDSYNALIHIEENSLENITPTSTSSTSRTTSLATSESNSSFITSNNRTSNKINIIASYNENNNVINKNCNKSNTNNTINDTTTNAVNNNITITDANITNDDTTIDDNSSTSAHLPPITLPIILPPENAITTILNTVKKILSAINRTYVSSGSPDTRWVRN